MAVTIKLRYIRHSAKKLRPYARLFVGKPLQGSINKSMLMPQDSAQFIYKALLMARAAAESKEFKPEEMIVSMIMADEGPRIKRMRPNARGRSNRYQKHLAHLTLSVDVPKIEPKKIEEKPKTAKKAVAKKGEKK
jgi:large subunit ribosomal protein L22